MEGRKKGYLNENSKPWLLQARERLTQPITLEEKTALYNQVKDNARKHLPAEGFDAAGYNLLHWAAFYGNAAEVRRVAAKVEVNDVNLFRHDEDQVEDNNVLTGMSPLYIAAFHGYEEVVRVLLENNADPHLYPTHNLIAFWPVAFEIANKRGHYSVVSLLAIPRLDKYLAERSADKRIYKSFTLSCFCTVFYFGAFTREQKLLAASALRAIIADETRQNNVAMLEALAIQHPAVNQSELGKIYQIILNTAKASGPRLVSSTSSLASPTPSPTTSLRITVEPPSENIRKQGW